MKNASIPLTFVMKPQFCPGCGAQLEPVKTRRLKTRREIQVTYRCPKCQGRFKFRLQM